MRTVILGATRVQIPDDGMREAHAKLAPHLSYDGFRNRVYRGTDVSKPRAVRHGGKQYEAVFVNGKRKMLTAQQAVEYAPEGLKISSIYARLNRGWAIDAPIKKMGMREKKRTYSLGKYFSQWPRPFGAEIDEIIRRRYCRDHSGE